jgi:hypothetical protein
MVTMQGPVPPHPSPSQPTKVEPVAADVVRMTTVPALNDAEHTVLPVPQASHAGLLLTVPLPAPALVTVKLYVGSMKTAVTCRAWLIVRVQEVLVPTQSPLQPTKVEPVQGATVNVTAVPLAKFAKHSVPQAIPAGLLVTVPYPLPPIVTLRGRVSVGGRKVELTVLGWVIVRVHVFVPPQSPPQPPKVEPGAGVPTKVTVEPAVKEALHATPQLIPGGVEVTAPIPVPTLVTVRVAASGLNSSTPISTTATPFPLPSRILGSVSKSADGRPEAELSPASMEGEPTWR